MGAHVFVDESKARTFLIAAVAITPDQMKAARSAVRSLLLPGQPRLHMKNEKESLKRQILSTFASLDFAATIYVAENYRTELAARDGCLTALVKDCARDGYSYLVLDRDDTLVSRDRQTLLLATRAAEYVNRLPYRHDTAASEPLLAIPDAIAWAWAKGGIWRQRCEPMLSEITRVDNAKPERHDHSGRVSGSLHRSSTQRAL